MRLYLPFACALLLPAPVGAAEPAPPIAPDILFEKYLVQETEKLSQRFLDGAKTRQEWEQKRDRLRREYLHMLGLWPLPERTPLITTITGSLERSGVVIDKLHFQSRPGLYVTGNLYRPKQASGRLPAILYVCGHTNKGRDGNKTAFQDHGLWFARHGYVCLVIDTLQLGEVAGKHHGTYNLERWWWHSAGYTPAGVECWNGIRALDYLVSRPDVDPERLGVTGISGGGAATVWIAAADERVRCAVPVSGMSDLQSYVSNKVINGHCDCMFLVNSHGWEWTTILALVAPRPLLFANSDNDRIFPMDGNRRIMDRMRGLYKLYEQPALVDDYVSAGGHDYRPDLRLAIFRWINKHLKQDTAEIQDDRFETIAGQDLRVFPEDKDLPADSLNGSIDETFVSRAKVPLPEAKDFASWQKDLLGQLRQRSFRRFPERLPVATFESKLMLLTFSARRLETEAGIICVIGTDSAMKPNPTRATLLVKSFGEESNFVLPPEPDWLTELVDQEQFHQLWLRGGTTKKSPPNYFERSHVLLGRTIDDGRVWDVAATVRYLAGEDKAKRGWRVIGRGQAGVIAAYAALFEPAITEVVLVDPPASHLNNAGPHFLGVLRTLDIPQALGLLAPRPLTLINAKDPAFQSTEQIYKLAGVPERCQRR